MHFHNGHSKLREPQLKLIDVCVWRVGGGSSSKVYTTCTVEGSDSGHVWTGLFIPLGLCVCVCCDSWQSLLLEAIL